MGLLDDAVNDLRERGENPDADDDDDEIQGAVTATLSGRDASVTVAGESIDIEDVDTVKTGGEGSWLSGTGEYGVPRGAEALENRQIVQTAAMQSIVNGVVDQLLGGNLAFEDDDDVMADLGPAQESVVGEFRELLRDILSGPHLGGESLDDLVTAAVEDMMGPGNAYWQLLGSDNGELPVVAMTTLDPLTIRRNVNRHGVPKDPPYWQAQGAFSGGAIANLSAVDPVPLKDGQIFEFSYPKGHRSYEMYPKSPAWQVKEWLKILADSTTHHSRFYSDNEIPPGLLQIINASSNTVEDVKQKIQDASGDPRDVPIIGGEGSAAWLDMGGTAVNLNVIEEQRWFYFLCLGSLGLGKAEVGMIEDVNRANGEIESQRVFKRVTGPFMNQFEAAFKHVARQFDIYGSLGEPFTPTLAFTDPREEHAREQRLREQFSTGVITLRQYVRRSGNTDLADDDEAYTIEIDGEEIDYGDHPRWVAERLMSAVAGQDMDIDDDAGTEDDEQAQTLGVAPEQTTPRHNGGGD